MLTEDRATRYRVVVLTTLPRQCADRCELESHTLPRSGTDYLATTARSALRTRESHTPPRCGTDL